MVSETIRQPDLRKKLMISVIASGVESNETKKLGISSGKGWLRRP